MITKKAAHIELAAGSVFYICMNYGAVLFYGDGNLRNALRIWQSLLKENSMR
ncbi:MAG: hypothetical protein ABR577_16745 [Pyrinomonadaceae bacterium]